LTARGNLAVIRTAAQNFNTLPSVVANNIGHLLMWTITCCGRQREILRKSPFEDPTKAQMADELLAAAKDLMVFAGLVKYKLPPRVFEALARAGQDAGAY
jgi:nuclear pore complex protein Nup93